VACDVISLQLRLNNYAKQPHYQAQVMLLSKLTPLIDRHCWQQAAAL